MEMEMEPGIGQLEKELHQLHLQLQVLMTEDEYIKCEQSLYEYFVVAWQLFDSAPLKTNWHIGAIASQRGMVQASCSVGFF